MYILVTDGASRNPSKGLSSLRPRTRSGKIAVRVGRAKGVCRGVDPLFTCVQYQSLNISSPHKTNNFFFIKTVM